MGLWRVSGVDFEVDRLRARARDLTGWCVSQIFVGWKCEQVSPVGFLLREVQVAVELLHGFVIQSAAVRYRFES